LIIDDMIQYFQKYGELIDCTLMYDKLSGKHRGKIYMFYIK